VAGRTTAQGYGFSHQQFRKRVAILVAQGGYVCPRYGHPQFPHCPGEILPDEEWELGHDDHDKRIYTGPEHARCNERAGGLKRQGLLEDGQSWLQW
jgi:hypothetical protein